jgi:beta-glucosidase
MAYLTGDFPPGKKSLLAVLKVITNMIRGHAAAYNTIHEIQPEAQVGLAHQYRGFQPARIYSPLDHVVTNFTSLAFNDLIPRTLKNGSLHFMGIRKSLTKTKGTQDFFGLNYYTQGKISFDLFNPGELFSRRFFPPEATLSPTGFIANEPEGFFQALNWAKRYKLPIIITENGVEDPDDNFRTCYLAEHIHKLWHAVNFNWNIRGYYYWSLVDNFEWERGWTQRFGLWELNLETQERIKRPSVDFYTAICQENALSSEMVARFSPDVFEKLFPN